MAVPDGITFDQTATPASQPPAGVTFDQTPQPAPNSGDNQTIPKDLQAPEHGSDEWYKQTIAKAMPEGSLEAGQKYLVDPFERLVAWGTKHGGAAAVGTAKNIMEHPIQSAISPESAIAFGDEGTEEFRKAHPVVAGAARGAGGVVGGVAIDPRNWPLMGAGEALPVLNKLLTAGFGAMMTKGAYNAAKQLHDNWDNMTPEERSELATQTGLNAVMATASALHMAEGKGTDIKNRVKAATDLGMQTKETSQGERIPVRSETLGGKVAGQLVSPDVMKDIAQEKTAPAVQKAVGNIVREATGSTAYTISHPEAGDSFGLAGHSANLRAQATPVFDRIDELYDGALARAKDKMSSANGDQEQYAEGRAEQKALYDKSRDQLADEGMDVDHADQQYRRSIQVEKMRAAFERSINPDTGDLSGKRLSSEIGKLVQKGEKGAFERGDLTQEHVDALKEVANIMKDQEKPPTQYIYGAAKTIAALTGVHLGGFGGLVEGTIGESAAEAVSRRVSDKLFADALAEPSAASRLPKALKTGDVQPVVSALQKSDPTWLDRTKAFVKNVLIKGTRGEAGAPGSVNEEDHSPELRDFSKEYTGGKDIDTAKVEPDTRRAAISDAYDKMEHAPNDLAVKKTYDALINETKAQWEGLKARGYKVDTTSNPEHYKNAQDMIDDVRNNKHLTVWDGGAPPADHPLSTVDPDSGMTNNTLFRAVHDILGHAKEGNDFSEKGEENAFRQHSQMYSKDAQAALATETRGQAASVFHHNGEFPEQKAAILPERFHGGNEPVTLHHWSNVDDLTETNPEKMGTGKAGREMARANEPGFLKRTNFGDDSYKERAIQGQKNHYTAQVDPAKYYDIEKDPEGIWQEALRTQGATAAERAVHDAGYDGYRNGGEYASFEKVPVRQAGAHATNNASGESAASVEAQNRLKRQNAQGVRVYDVDSRMAGSKNAWHPVMATVDRVDQQAQPFHHLVEIDKDGHTQVLNSGEGALPLPPDARIRALVGQAAGEAPTTSARPIKDYSQSEIGTRYPSAADAAGTNDPSALTGLDALNEADRQSPSRTTQAGKPVLGIKQKMVAALADYKDNGISNLLDAKRPDEAIEKYIEHVKGNLKWLHDATPESIRSVAKQWYDTAHNATKDIADANGVTHEQAAAVTAALSPKNDWNTNVEQAKRLIEHYTHDQDHAWTDKMDDAVQNIKRNGAVNDFYKKMLNDIRGKKVNEITAKTPEALLAKQAVWYRILDEAHGAKEAPIHAPDGSVQGYQTMNWGQYEPVAKALGILKDGSVENINAMMGEGHKIRNFYNNIINPMSERGHTTIDTHAVGAAHLKPYSQDDVEVAHNFGSGNKQGTPSPAKHAGTGLKGSYPVHEEAYRRAADELGIQPRQLQSITWEGIRSLMGDEKKTPELRRAVTDIWRAHEAGQISLDQARNEIVTASGGFSKPNWMSDEQWEANPAEEGDTSFGEQ